MAQGPQAEPLRRAQAGRTGPAACLGSAVAAGTPSLTGRRLPNADLADLQRGKVLCGAVRAFSELGYERATVAQIIARARVSRSSFYELFSDRDACLAEVLAATARTLTAELGRARVEELPWSGRVRATLMAILELFDREPAVARVCVVESLRAGPVVLERRTRILARLAAILDQGRSEHACGAHCTPLTAEALVGAVFAILHSRLLREPGAPLRELAGDLDGILLLPYARPDDARQAA